MEQTTLTDQDRAILSRLAMPALRNESRTDDSADYRAMRARNRVKARWNAKPRDCVEWEIYWSRNLSQDHGEPL